MKALLMVSVAPGAVSEPDLRAISLLHIDSLATVLRLDGGWLAHTRADTEDAFDEPAHGFTVRLTRSTRTRSTDLDASTLAAMLGDGGALAGDALAGLLPPFAAAHWAGPGRPMVLAGDWLGLRQIYWWQGDGIAAVSTSAPALAAVAGASLDQTALAIQSLMGWQAGLATLFDGVTKLDAGSAAILHGGQVRIQRYVEPYLAIDRGLGLSVVVERMAETLRAINSSYLDDHPDTMIQLSGGQDSRLLLCAVPPPQRKGLRAFTIDLAGGVESAVARRLRDLCDLDHEVHLLDAQPPIAPAEAHRLALAAAHGLDCMASPLALAPLALMEATIEQGHRFAGTGGETARGFYYPGQPRHGDTTRRLLQRLAGWRLFANEAVSAEALDPEFAATAHARAFGVIEDCFADLSTEWLRATDEFYLYQRTQRWAGAHSTVAAVRRHYVNPLLDREFLRLALTPAPHDKRDSRLTGLLMNRLDPALAAVPLDTGLVPARMAHPGVARTISIARYTATKTARKVRQRLGGSRRDQLGAAGFASLVVAAWRSAPESVEPLRHIGVIAPAWLDELLDGRRSAPASTIAFLVNLLVAADAVGPP
jgi:asparagine synthase (glutamine-hydrolysing)